MGNLGVPEGLTRLSLATTSPSCCQERPEGALGTGLCLLLPGHPQQPPPGSQQAKWQLPAEK